MSGLDPIALGLWILKDGTPARPATLREWGEFMENAARIVEHVTIGPYFISTVFLGMDHAFCGGPPVLWESMIFCENGVDPAGLAETMQRYGTLGEAKAGHRELVDLVEAALSIIAAGSSAESSSG